MAELSKDLFCAKCQQVTSHKGEVDMNGEFLFSCKTADCGRFLKFPADTNIEQFNTLVEEHAKVNDGQISLEGQEKKLEELLTAPESTPVAEETPQA